MLFLYEILLTVGQIHTIESFIYQCRGFMEIPGCLMSMPFLSLWGRRPTAFLCFLFTGLSALAITAIPAQYETFRTVLIMSGKFFIAAAFNAIYLVATEVYPTESRTTGRCAASIMGRFGSIAAPYVADLLVMLRLMLFRLTNFR
jgi:MFS family permease